MKIAKIRALEILDSRGNPTVETFVFLENGLASRAAVPSGASTGTKEALELRDGDEKRYHGKGVLKAIENIEEKIAPLVEGMEVDDLKEIDRKMLEADGTKNKSNFGANAILSVSLAVARAGASAQNDLALWRYLRQVYNLKDSWQFPVPMMNVINGGAHSDSGLDIQEFMLVPSGIEKFSERIRAGAEIYHTLMKIFKENNQRIAVGDEGGFAPRLSSNEEALKFIAQAVEESGYELGKEVRLGLDAAASEFYDEENQKYNLKLDGISIDKSQLASLYQDWIGKYQLELIEDPMSELDWEGWKEFYQKEKERIAIIGDDLIVTNVEILKKAIEQKACNAVLIKPNQIGTVTETIDCIKLAQENGLKIAVSHRSGETGDEFVADLAFAVGADYIKSGAPARGERVGKYNRLLRIEKRMEWHKERLAEKQVEEVIEESKNSNQKKEKIQ